jgi:hypothetical protein
MAEDVIVSKSKKVKSTYVLSDSRRAEYEALYERLMARAKDREYLPLIHERHHILPKSMGGSDDAKNIAVLTYKEHFLAHWVLTKIKTGKDRYLALFALRRMTHKNKNQPSRVVAGWQYELARKANHEAMLDNKLALGAKPSKKTIEKLRKRMRGNTLGRLLKGVKQSPERKAKTSKALKNNPNVISARIGNTNTKRRPVRCLNDGRIFPMLKAAAEHYSIHGTSIWCVCTGRIKSVKGYVFEYIT